MKMGLILLLFFSRCVIGFAQHDVLGKYEYSTSATEHFGVTIEVLPNKQVNYYFIRYGTSSLDKTGSWKLRGDTLVILWKDKTVEKFLLVSDNLLSDIVSPSYETLEDGKKVTNWIATSYFVKTTSFYSNGKTEVARTWKSNNRHNPILIADGKWVYFYESGSKQAEGDYSNGEKTGAWFYFAEDGSYEIIKED